MIRICNSLASSSRNSYSVSCPSFPDLTNTLTGTPLQLGISVVQLEDDARRE